MDNSSPAVQEVLAAIAKLRSHDAIDQLPLHHRVSTLVEDVGRVATAVFGLDLDDVVRIEVLRAGLRTELIKLASDALVWLDEDARALEKAKSGQLCTACGHPRNNHPYRHPFMASNPRNAR